LPVCDSHQFFNPTARRRQASFGTRDDRPTLVSRPPGNVTAALDVLGWADGAADVFAHGLHRRSQVPWPKRGEAPAGGGTPQPVG
jgi:hypothetical protein